MSTPVGSISPQVTAKHKRTPTNELQEQMKLMIRLQYEQQQYVSDAPPPVPKNSSMELGGKLPPKPSIDYKDSLPEHTQKRPPRFPEDPEVGHGTLLFPQPSRASARTVSERISENSPLEPSHSSYGTGPSVASHSSHDPVQSVHPQTHSTSPSKKLLQGHISTPLRRSFCFGAIDGLLTGSGIWATFQGMHFLDKPSIVVTIFTAAACFSDALCMAVGHVWSSNAIATVQAREREETRLLLRDEAKSELIHLLLSKGVLKIDAVSLADTLEGYPDLMLAAVTGEPLLSPTDDDVGARQSQSDEPIHQEMDPSAVRIQAATGDALIESIFMLLGFSSFALVPSILHVILPADSTSGDDQTVHSSTAHIALIMLYSVTLGIWKARLLDSNWLLFGLESVLVLLLCLGVAYGVGAGLNSMLLPHKDYVLSLLSTGTRPSKITQSDGYY